MHLSTSVSGFNELMPGRNENVVPNHAIDGRSRAVLPVLLADEQAELAVEHGIAFQQRALHLLITGVVRLKDAVHESERASVLVAIAILDPVVPHHVIFTDDPDAAGILVMVPCKEVAFDKATVRVAQGQGAFALDEGVVGKPVFAALHRDDLTLSIAVIKKIAGDFAFRILIVRLAVTQADGFPSVSPSSEREPK